MFAISRATHFKVYNYHLLRPGFLARVRRHPTQIPSRKTHGVGPPAFSAQRYLRNTAFSVDFFRRFLKFTAVGFLVAGVTTWTIFEGSHHWVENVELALETDPKVREWQWDLEADRWARGASGGTDPGLGFVGRHAIRAAWMAQNWGVGSNLAASDSLSGRSGSGIGDLRVVEARLEIAHSFLGIAIQAAMQRASSVQHHTLTELLQRDASIMERMGTRQGLLEARRGLERVWASLPGRSIDAARVALKLGDLNQRIGDREDALAWWARAMNLVTDNGPNTISESPPLVPTSLPLSPIAQRTLASALVPMSAFYATNGQLRQAEAFENSSLDLLSASSQPKSFTSTSAPQALHSLYIIHRTSLICVHLAEVLYALQRGSQASMDLLTRAVELSERVAFALADFPSACLDAPGPTFSRTPSSERPLDPAFSEFSSMRKPAKGLLRDSRRTAAEAWNLIGVLTEATGTPEGTKQALGCYERAVEWAGVATVGTGGKAAEGTLEAERKALWRNYVQAQNAVKDAETKTG